MPKYRGRMRTALLNDRQIHPTQHTSWDSARRYFDNRTKDRATVTHLKQSIPQNGLRKPLILGISDRTHDVYVADGHHRAIALIDLGIPAFTFHWYWIRSFGVHIEHQPFPEHLANL